MKEQIVHFLNTMIKSSRYSSTEVDRAIVEYSGDWVEITLLIDGYGRHHTLKMKRDDARRLADVVTDLTNEVSP